VLKQAVGKAIAAALPSPAKPPATQGPSVDSGRLRRAACPTPCAHPDARIG
jgi:hypothetical protein